MNRLYISLRVIEVMLGSFSHPRSGIKALSRGPGAVVRRQARKTLHKAVNIHIR